MGALAGWHGLCSSSRSMDSRRRVVPLERLTTEEMLACVEPFTAARPEEVAMLARAVSRVRKVAGSLVIREGQVPDAMYVVLRGRMNLVRAADGGRDLILNALGAGDVFGEGCALDGLPASTTAIAAVTCDLARIPADAVAAHLRREPATVLRVSRMVGEKLRDAESVASGLALCDVEERLRRTLARLARRQGRPDADEGWILAPVPTQSELARMVGSCRETVSRTLSSMARNGLVSGTGRRLVLSPTFMAGA